MNYQALHDFIKDISGNLGLTRKWFHGRKPNITETTPDRPLYVYCLPFRSNGNLTNQTRQVNETWEVNVIFYMQDRAESGIDQNDQDKMQDEIRILTICEEAANRFIHFMNENELSDDLSDAADQLTVLSFTKAPVIKDTAQMLTGFIVTMNLLVPDSFVYCCPVDEDDRMIDSDEIFMTDSDDLIMADVA